jgi:hypothetical protein
MTPVRRVLDSQAARSFAAFLYSARWVLAAFVASRLLLFAVILLSRMIMVRGELWHPGGLLSVLEQFDGELWYMTIARDGYFYSTTEPSPVPFFPMFPILMKLVSFVFHDMRIAGFIVPHVCLLATALFLKALVELDYERPVARAAVVFLLFNPVSLFHSSAYSESTFLMFATGSLLAARKGHWLVAGLAGMCLAMTRNIGVLIALPLAIEYVRQAWSTKTKLSDVVHPRVLFLALVPLGLAAYMFYGYVRWDDPLAFLHASKVWGRSFTSPAQTFTTLVHYRPMYKWLFLGTMGTALALLVIGAALRVRLSYLVWCAALTTMYLCAATMEAWPRYLSVEFPLYIILALIATRLRCTYEPLLACSTGLFVLSAVLSANGYWFT